MPKNSKYVILQRISKESARKQEQLKKALTGATALSWKEFQTIARADEDNTDLSFSSRQLISIAAILGCSIHKLYTPTPYYRIREIMKDSFNEEELRDKLFEK